MWTQDGDRHGGKMRTYFAIVLAAAVFGIAGCGTPGKAPLNAETESPKIEDDQFFSNYLYAKMPGRSLHTFGENDLKCQFLNISPQLHSVFTPEFTAAVFSKLQKIYSLEIETAREGIHSDEEMAQYLLDGGVLKELGISKSAALKALKETDPGANLIHPLAKFTRYHAIDPPGAPVRLPGEFEPAGAVYVSWPRYDTWVWDRTASLVKETKDVSPAWIFVPNEYWQKAVELYLSKKGIGFSNVKFLHIPTDDAWARNWGQLTVFSGEKGEPAFIRAALIGYAGGQPYAKQSSEAVAAFGQYMDVPVYQLPLITELGGNVITDGNGTIITSQHFPDQNPDVGRENFKKILRDYLGCEQLIVIPDLKGEVCGHADILVKFADPRTVFVASVPQGTPWYEDLEKIAEIIAGAKSLSGVNYKVVTLPMPTNQDFSKDSKDWSYINSLTVNKKIIVPLYGAPEDEQALRIYRETLPGYEVVGIDWSPYFFGAIHCQTQDVPPAVTNRIK
ncbi:MAG: agmatine deiminase family protein [PVC group bacterium]